MLDRLIDKNKRWKFNENDLTERKLWKEHQAAFESALPATSSKEAPWFVIPADDKWYARAAIADIVSAHLESLDLDYPKISESEEPHFESLIAQLQAEK